MVTQEYIDKQIADLTNAKNSLIAQVGQLEDALKETRNTIIANEGAIYELNKILEILKNDNNKTSTPEG